MDLTNSVVIVTGAAGGIGSATACELAKKGAKLVLADISTEGLDRVEQLVHRQGGTALSFPTDITDYAQVEQMIDHAIKAYGQVDALVNCAGVGSSNQIMGCDYKTLQDVIDINLVGPIFCIRAVVPYMKQRKAGVIVNLGSVAGEIGMLGIYTATKFGLRGVSESIQRELKRDGIHVVLVEPGFIDTAMTQDVKRRAPKFPMSSPQLVGNTIARVIQHPRNKVIVPWPYRILVFLAHLLPWLVRVNPETEPA